MKCAVLGYPIKHSKSPLIHQYWLNQNDIEGAYEAIEIHPDNLVSDINKLIDDGYNGFNVTVPHKQSVMSVCDEVDDIAKAIGAVNTIYIRSQKIHGTNTDAFGFIENIKQQSNFDFKNKNVCVLGAGGAARAVIYGLISEGAQKIYLTNRTKEKAIEVSELASEKIDVINWNDRSAILKDVDLLVNTTSLGMEGKPPLDIDISALPSHAVVNDIVYAPLMTDLLKAAEAQGNGIVTGIGMLLHQARPAFEKWTGVLPDVTDELEAKVLV